MHFSMFFYFLCCIYWHTVCPKSRMHMIQLHVVLMNLRPPPLPWPLTLTPNPNMHLIERTLTIHLKSMGEKILDFLGPQMNMKIFLWGVDGHNNSTLITDTVLLYKVELELPVYSRCPAVGILMFNVLWIRSTRIHCWLTWSRAWWSHYLNINACMYILLPIVFISKKQSILDRHYNNIRMFYTIFTQT